MLEIILLSLFGVLLIIGFWFEDKVVKLEDKLFNYIKRRFKK